MLCSPKRIFTNDELDRFNDKIENCLCDEECKMLLKEYIKKKKPPFRKVFRLWEMVNNENESEEDLMDLIEEINSFNSNPLLSLAEKQQKMDYIKSECVRLLEPVRRDFVEHLRKNNVPTK